MCSNKRRRGSKGEPSPGVPPFLYSFACAPLLWAVVVSLSCLSTPFLWCLPKETVSSRQRKALFCLGGSTIRVSAAASVDGTFLARLGEGAGAGFWRIARLKVSSTFSKVAGCRGSAPARAPQSAELSLCSHKRRRGAKGEPSPGVPPYFLRLYVCAVALGGGRWSVLRFDPISLVLAQRNGVEPPKKSAFLPRRLHHSRERYCLGGRGPSSPDFRRGLVGVCGIVRVRRFIGQ